MNKIAQVLIASHTQQLDRLFDYLTPAEFGETAKIGARVIVPFQNQLSIGYIWSFTDYSEFKNLKSIVQIVDDPPLISNIQFQLAEWISEYYYCCRTDVLKLFFPPGSNPVKVISYRVNLSSEDLTDRLKRILEPAKIKEIIALLNELDGEPVKQWNRKFANLPEVWDFLIKQRIIVKTVKYASPKTKAKVIPMLCWVSAETEENRATGQRVRKVLLQEKMLTRSQLCAAAEVSSSVIDRLIKEGKVIGIKVAEERKPIGFSEVIPLSDSCRFNSEQAKVFEKFFTNDATRLFLLHGVTGSGKTEVYLKAAAEVLAKGKQALYLVPEIALTPQTLERTRLRFGEQVALLHSNMSDGERYDQWFNIKNGKAKLVLGARSALFAPFEDLGLIIVDEEHESSYKQEETPRYHSRTVVEKLAELSGAKVIFGSATPSLESFYAAQNQKYCYLSLKERFNQQPLPPVSIVDMREELRKGNKNILSEALFEAVNLALTEKEQVILLLNRRGYSTFILCRDCGYTLTCPECDVSLTYHLSEKVLRCHYCDYRQPIPNLCPKCKSSRIRYFGHGTQRLEEELAKCYPQAKIVRMDLDSTSRKGTHHRIYQELTSGEVDILLGTQMVAKGLDLPRVTLVGVISADSTLNIPDFRAAERTFQLLTQVAGRAGRGEKNGRVIFQTYNPDHYSLQLAKEHDYLGFYQAEIERRRDLQYPPFAEFVKIAFTGLNSEKVRQAAETLAQVCRELISESTKQTKKTYLDFELMGPAPALIPKIESKFRWQLLIKSKQPAGNLNNLMRNLWEQFPFRKFNDVKIIKDRNPYSIV
ncbi:MAG: primosomal protein N' [Firmicutes bacterium]|nr:primosomal protein N' [Bacillota bacterium]